MNSTTKNYVVQVNESEVVAWAQSPVSVEEYQTRTCRTVPPSRCPSPNTCVLTAEHDSVSNQSNSVKVLSIL